MIKQRDYRCELNTHEDHRGEPVVVILNANEVIN